MFYIWEQICPIGVGGAWRLGRDNKRKGMKFRLGPDFNWHGMAGLDFMLQVVVTLNYFSTGKAVILKKIIWLLVSL